MRKWVSIFFSLGITALAIGGTLYFFTRSATDPKIESQEAQKSQESQKNIQSPIQVANLSEEEYLERYQQANTFHKEEKLLEARLLLKDLIKNAPHLSFISRVQDLLWVINIQLLLSPEPPEEWVQIYEVKRGDSVYTIAKKYNVSAPLIIQMNNIKKGLIYPKQKLKIIPGTFNILIDKSLNVLTLRLDEEVLKIYPVGTGKNNNTPVGEFKVVNKIEEPAWHKNGQVIPFGDPNNLLGTRWMGFDIKGYGIHGTWDPASIGHQSSEGCVRLNNQDVEELFQIIPVGASIRIVD